MHVQCLLWDSLIGCAPAATISAQLQHAQKNSDPGEVIRLSDLTDFEWEAFVVFGPYTSREAAEAALGFSWPQFERFGLEYSDSFSLLVFTNEGSVVRVEEHPRCKPDFGRETLGRLLSPAAALLLIDSGSQCPQARAAA
jgi:hypothetical protein